MAGSTCSWPPEDLCRMRPRTLLTGSELKSSPKMRERTQVYILQEEAEGEL